MGEEGKRYTMNMHQVEQAWKKARKMNSPPEDVHALLDACEEGCRLFPGMVSDNGRVPEYVPCYRRQVSVLEAVGRCEEALAVAQGALDLGIPDERYETIMGELGRNCEGRRGRSRSSGRVVNRKMIHTRASESMGWPLLLPMDSTNPALDCGGGAVNGREGQ